MFVGDVHNGRIYHFELTGDRTHLILPPQLAGTTNWNNHTFNESMFDEIWTDKESLEAHLKQPYIISAVEQMTSLLA